MTPDPQPQAQVYRAARRELAEAETLRVHAATVGDTPDFRAERRALVVKARALRLAHQG